MTLHLIRSELYYTLHASDRKLTLASGAAFDETANKAIILWARDAWVSIGFAGVAYLDGTPTDQWLVEKITGRTYPRYSAPAPTASYLDMSVIQPPGRWESIGIVLSRLQRELEGWRRRANPIDRLQYLEIAVAGHALRWQSRKKLRCHPLLAFIRKPSGDEAFTREVLARRWHLGGDGKYASKFAHFPSHLTTEELARLGVHLQKRHSAPDVQAEAVEIAFADTIKQVAQREPRVGGSVMSVLLPPPLWPARARFIPPARASVDQCELVPAYSPWIVGRYSVHPPFLMRGGGWQVSLGRGFRVDLDYPAQAVQVRKISELALFPQPRPQWRGK